MRSSCLALLSLAALAACTTQQARRTDTTSPAAATLAGAPATEAAVKQAIDSADARFGVAAMKGDVAALASFYTDDAMFMGPNAPAYRGHDAITKNFADIIAAAKLSAFKLQSTDVIASGDYAIETGTYDQTFTLPKATKAIHDVGKFVVIWKKQTDGSYKIIRDVWNSDLPEMK